MALSWKDKISYGCNKTFTSEAKRIEFLFEFYEKYTAGLFVKEKKSKK
jgi:hypothetical protein